MAKRGKNLGQPSISHIILDAYEVLVHGLPRLVLLDHGVRLLLSVPDEAGR